ncbi:hypothetical protein JXB02_02030 [Candidatus Woesearchaeota archaeon]|nr:hypothetical protein [Candidatus Woesearchaeota archaeon]
MSWVFYGLGLLPFAFYGIFYLATRSHAKAALFSGLGFTAVTAALSFFIISDIIDMRDRFLTEPNLFLLRDDDGFVAGFSGSPLEQDEVVFPGGDELDRCWASYAAGDSRAVLGSYYKLFVLDKDALLANVPEEIGLQGETFDRAFLERLLAAEDPIGLFLRERVFGETYDEFSPDQMAEARAGLEAQLGDAAELKGRLFGVLFGAAMAQAGPSFLFDGYKAGSIEVIPESPAFMLVRNIPDSILDTARGIAMRELPQEAAA